MIAVPPLSQSASRAPDPSLVARPLAAPHPSKTSAATYSAFTPEAYQIILAFSARVVAEGKRPFPIGKTSSRNAILILHAKAPHIISEAMDSGNLTVQRAQARVGLWLRGKWHLDKLLGVGGMAAVYAGTHRNGSRGAVKLLHAAYSEDAEARARFLREGYVANKVEHTGAVQVLDDDVNEDGTVFLVWKLSTEGPSKRSRSPNLRIASISSKSCRSPTVCSTCSSRRMRMGSCTGI